jgi:hypothetical protein
MIDFKALNNGPKDMMWRFLMEGGQMANVDALEASVHRLIRMAIQKNAGQREGATCIDWNNLDMELTIIAIEATSLVLDDRFNKVKELLKEEA